MTLVSGKLSTITGDPSRVTGVKIKADRIRPSITGVTTAENEDADWDAVAGDLSFTAEPGDAIIILTSGQRVDSIPISVPEAATATLDEVVSARFEYTPPVVNRGLDLIGDARDEALRQVAEASRGSIVVVYSEEEAAALPIGTIYAIVPELAPQITIVGSSGANLNTGTFKPNIPGATTGDTIIIAVNTKAVSGSKVTAPAGFTTLVDGYWIGTQRSWVFSGPWSGNLTITASQPLELAYAAVAVRGAKSVTKGLTKDRTMAPTETTTVTAPAVGKGYFDLAIGIAFERTSSAETPDQVTVNADWTIEHYTAQGTNFQTVLIGVGGTGDMVATYPNAQATNGLGVQVVARA